MASGKLLLFITAVLGFLSSVQGITNKEALQICKNKSTIPVRNFAEANLKNDNCAIDCITKRGAFFTFPIREKGTCASSNGYDYQCLFGKCRPIDAAAVSTLNLWSLEMEVKKGQFVVDQLRASDIFITIRIKTGGSPTYNDGELVCRTKSVGNNDQPEWDGFVCEPLPIHEDTRLEFVAWNGLGGSPEPELLGKASEKVENLMHGEPLTLKMEGGQHIIVEISGKRYEEKNCL